MAEHTVRREQEIFSLSVRPFQQAKESSKTICFKCFEDDGLVNFFAEGAGLSQHFRTMHHNTDVDIVKCKAVFNDHHGEEMASVVERLSRLRLQLCTNEADNLTYFEYTVRLDGDAAGTKIVAKTRREAAKLYGLVLHHRGKLRALGDRPCVIQVEENIPNSNGQSYRAWNAGNKIYVECFIPSRRMLSITHGNTPLTEQHYAFAGEYSTGSRNPLEVLHSVFGHTEFRPGQWNSISKILSGKDVIVVIPTGGGKTVVYALPCIMMPGLAVVISPLIMLMCDQVARLRGCGINTCYYNTMLSDNERQNILHNLKQPNCQYQFVFISPEAVITDSLQSCLDTLSQENDSKCLL
ncbi:hypothetical protein OS493_006936 [Desmophyllum pertusum]|uniref:DNA 3'-5' helicase n=1 Tax=Desmophyllum pertusum TaxID=174260 RepID=A0A9W9ZS63_9CNID|nr:hypothetical protein OS493_006936 [Desmophyllum pertusum]